MSESVGQASGIAPGVLPPITVTAPSDAADGAPSSLFHTLLSELNPLQYIPVVGTIYRAATGDTIPESVRDLGSLLVSGLIGGPIGAATNMGLLALEKVTGIDPEKIGADLLASIGIGDTDPVAPTPTGASGSQTAPPSPPAASVAWSQAQLAAYGVTTGPNGELRHGDLKGADVLNDLVLAQLAGTKPPG